jgi:hypothetical protein
MTVELINKKYVSMLLRLHFCFHCSLYFLAYAVWLNLSLKYKNHLLFLCVTNVTSCHEQNLLAWLIE